MKIELDRLFLCPISKFSELKKISYLCKHQVTAYISHFNALNFLQLFQTLRNWILWIDDFQKCNTIILITQIFLCIHYVSIKLNYFLGRKHERHYLFETATRIHCLKNMTTVFVRASKMSLCISEFSIWQVRITVIKPLICTG